MHIPSPLFALLLTTAAATAQGTAPRGVVSASVQALTPLEVRTQLAGTAVSSAARPVGSQGPLLLYDQSASLAEESEAWLFASLEERNSIWTFGAGQGATVRSTGGLHTAEAPPHELLFRFRFQGPIRAELEITSEQFQLVSPTSFLGEVDVGNDGSLEYRAGVTALPVRIPVIQTGGTLEVRVRSGFRLVTGTSMAAHNSVSLTLRGTACSITAIGGGCLGNISLEQDVGGIVSIQAVPQPGPPTLSYLLIGTQRPPVQALGCSFGIAPALIVPMGPNPLTFDALALRPFQFDAQLIEIFQGPRPYASPVFAFRCP